MCIDLSNLIKSLQESQIPWMDVHQSVSHGRTLVCKIGKIKYQIDIKYIEGIRSIQFKASDNELGLLINFEVTDHSKNYDDYGILQDFVNSIYAVSGIEYALNNGREK